MPSRNEYTSNPKTNVLYSTNVLAHPLGLDAVVRSTPSLKQDEMVNDPVTHKQVVTTYSSQLGYDRILVQLVLITSGHLDGEDPDDVLYICSVYGELHRHNHQCASSSAQTVTRSYARDQTYLRLTHHLATFTDPLHKDKLLPLRLLVIGVLHAHIRVRRFRVVEEFTQFS